MALLTRRVRNTQEQLESLRSEMQLVNDAVQMATDSMQAQKRKPQVTSAIPMESALPSRSASVTGSHTPLPAPAPPPPDTHDHHSPASPDKAA